MTMQYAPLPRSGAGALMDAMYELVLRPTVLHNSRPKNDYAVIWKSDFGERRVGRIRLASEQSFQGTVWVFHLQADIPVPPWCNGRADSLKGAQAAFRQVFEKFCSDAGDLTRAFRAKP